MHNTDSADHAAHLAKRAALAQGVHAIPTKPVLHGDNGATLKATTVPAMLAWLGIKPSYLRPRVSDDNAFVEALFRTAKYQPAYPSKGFSGIRYVTPAQRHAGQDHTLLAHRHALYQQARQRNPQRRSRQTRKWTPVANITLNPERDTVIHAAAAQNAAFPRNMV